MLLCLPHTQHNTYIYIYTINTSIHLYNVMCADRSRVLPLTLSIDAVAVLLLGIYTCFGYFRWKPRDCRIYCSKYTLITTHTQHEPNEDQQKKTQRLAWCRISQQRLRARFVHVCVCVCKSGSVYTSKGQSDNFARTYCARRRRARDTRGVEHIWYIAYRLIRSVNQCVYKRECARCMM